MNRKPRAPKILRDHPVLQVEPDGTIHCTVCDDVFVDSSGASVAELRQAIREGDFDEHPCVRGVYDPDAFYGAS